MSNKRGWNYLSKGAVIDVVAPSYPLPQEKLEAARSFIIQCGFTPRIPDDLMGEDTFCANSESYRRAHLYHALTAADSDAVWCVRGGFGVTALLPFLASKPIPLRNKLCIGFSDITALHLFLQRQWGWKTLHGKVLSQCVMAQADQDSTDSLLHVIRGEVSSCNYALTPLNAKAREPGRVHASITGGNLSLVQCSIGTDWEVDTSDKWLFLEEVDERGYSMERMLIQLEQAGLLRKTEGVIFGDCIGGEEKDGSSLIDEALVRFALKHPFPVYRLPGIGHKPINYPLPLGTDATIHTTDTETTLVISTGGHA